MASLGRFLLLATFVLACGAFAASLAGARRRRQTLIEGGIGLFHVVTAMLFVGSAVLAVRQAVVRPSVRPPLRRPHAAAGVASGSDR